MVFNYKNKVELYLLKRSCKNLNVKHLLNKYKFFFNKQYVYCIISNVIFNFFSFNLFKINSININFYFNYKNFYLY